jgi:adenosine deaminase
MSPTSYRTAPPRGRTLYVMPSTLFLQQALPKIQLHCHLEGTLRSETFLELTERYGVSTRYAPGMPPDRQPHDVRDPARIYAFSDFGEFLMIFAAVCRTLKSPDDYARAAREYVEDALAQNVVYAELFVSPPVWTFFHRELDVEACLAAMHGVFAQAAGRLRVRLIYDLTRNFGGARALEGVNRAAQLAHYDVVAVGLGGDERRYPAELFVEAFERARELGLHRVVHAGETAGAQSVADSVRLLHAERIGHGVRAVEDDAVVKMLARSGITLECCPTSNVLTGAVGGYAEHPLVLLDERGVRVTVDCDDPAIFGTSITRELELVASWVGEHDVVRFTRNAVDGSFAEAGEKAALHAAIDAGLEAAGGRRM